MGCQILISSTLRNMPWVDAASMAMEEIRIFNAGVANGKALQVMREQNLKCDGELYWDWD
jgi:hypothetical protein